MNVFAIDPIIYLESGRTGFELYGAPDTHTTMTSLGIYTTLEDAEQAKNELIFKRYAAVIQSTIPKP